MRFSILYADPPWQYGNSQHTGKGGKTSGGAETHYPTMSVAEIAALDVVDHVDDDALIFLWTSSPHLDQAIALMPAWGFRFVTVGFVWDKMATNPGSYTLSQCELCLIGKRGKIPQPRGARNVRQLVRVPRGAHSAKPDEVRQRIEAMFPTQRKLELFARGKSPGWAAWGNEIESDVIVALRA